MCLRNTRLEDAQQAVLYFENGKKSIGRTQRDVSHRP
jgi:hypothetical protein